MHNRTGPHKNSTSGIRGVSLDKRSGRWRADIKLHGKQINLGYHVLKEDAASAYAAANKKYFGEFGGGL